jgi:c-di-GMP-binding flagellar brake protein YcgR
MQDADRELLHDAIARNAAAVLSLPSAGMLRHHKSRFLAEADEGFWIESAPQEKSLVEELIASQQSCGIAFKHGVNKVVFASPITARQSDYRINADTTVEAVLMRFPQQIKAVQRRNNYRAPIPAGSDITLKIWRMGPGVHLRDRPLAAQAIAVQLRDLSIGGMGVIFTGQDNQPPKVTNDDRLRIELTLNGEPLLLEGFMKHPQGKLTTPTVRAGLQFKDLGNDIEGRRILAALTRLVGELQRAEVRRYRLGVTSGK